MPAVGAVIPVVAHHEVLTGRHNPGGQRQTGLMVVHPNLILGNRHHQNSVRHVAQRLLTLGKTNAVGFGFALRQLPEPAARFAAVAAGEGLNKIARLHVGIGHRQRVAAGLSGTAARLNSDLFGNRIVGDLITR